MSSTSLQSCLLVRDAKFAFQLANGVESRGWAQCEVYSTRKRDEAKAKERELKKRKMEAMKEEKKVKRVKLKMEKMEEKNQLKQEERAMKGLNGCNKCGANVSRKKDYCFVCQICHVFWLCPAGKKSAGGHK